GARSQYVAERDDLSVTIGDLDTDRALSGDGREDVDLVRGDRVREVAAECGDALDLDAVAELDLVARDRRPARESRDLRIDLELREHVRDGRDHLVVDGGARLRRCPGDEERGGRQAVGPCNGGSTLPARGSRIRV